MLLPIFLVVLVDIFGMTLVIPLLAIYSESFGATAIQATMLVSVYAACSIVSGPLLGTASDRVGRKPMLLISQVGTLIGFLVMAQAHALWMVFLARILDGATAGNLSLAQAYIADNTKPENRAKSFAIIGIAFGLGFFIGPAITGYLVGYGLRAPILLAAGLSALSILFTAFLLPNQRPEDRLAGGRAGDRVEVAAGPDAPSRSSRPASDHAHPPAEPAGRRLGVLDWSGYLAYFRRPVLAGILVQFLFFSLSFATFNSGFALFSERTYRWNGHPFTPREIGVLFAYAGFLGIILQGGLIGRLVKRFGEPALAWFGFVIMAAGHLLLAVTTGIVWLAVSATFGSVGHGLLRPTLTSLVSRVSSREEQGVVLGLTQSLMSFAMVIAPPLGGWLIQSNWLPAWACLAAITSLIGALIAPWASGRASLTAPVPARSAP